MLNRLMESTKVVVALPPAADAAGRTGDWVNLSLCESLLVVVQVNQGNAATVALTFQQATAADGTGAKALSGTAKIWANLDAAASDAVVAQADAASFTTDAGLKQKLVFFRLNPRQVMDMNNGFKYLAVSTGASNAANITCAHYHLDQLVFQQAADKIPSVVV